MKYKTMAPPSTECWGGIQRDLAGIPVTIFGDVFLKGLFVVFESAKDQTPRLGFAQQASYSASPQDLVPQAASEPSNPFDQSSDMSGSGDDETPSPFSLPFGAEELS
jgi:hypothetical protein